MICGNGRQASRYRRSRRFNGEVNVTPFVDVMLVLLVIFMLTAPMLVSGIEVALPKTKTAPISGNDEPLVLSVDKGGAYYVQDVKVQYPKLRARIAAVLAERKDIRVFIRGDVDVNYGKIAGLLGLVKELGVTNMALVTEVDSDKPGVK